MQNNGNPTAFHVYMLWIKIVCDLTVEEMKNGQIMDKDSCDKESFSSLYFCVIFSLLLWHLVIYFRVEKYPNTD